MNTVLYKRFYDLLNESDRKEYRECSINQQKEWYIHYLERRILELIDSLDKEVTE